MYVTGVTVEPDEKRLTIEISKLRLRGTYRSRETGMSGRQRGLDARRCRCGWGSIRRSSPPVPGATPPR